MVYRLLIFFSLLFSGCSKLADYSADITTIPNPAPSPSVSVTVPDPIHQWGFESTPNDSVGSWNGTLQGAASYSTTAKVGSHALGLSNAGDGFSLGNQTLPAEMTVSCWVNWNSTGGAIGTIIANSTSGAALDGIQLYVQTGGNVVLVTGNGTNQTTVTSTGVLPNVTYAHVVGVFDQVLSQSAIYINGVLDQSGGVESGYNITAANTYLGMAVGGSSLKGELDDCTIYNVALSAAQVALLYNSY